MNNKKPVIKKIKFSKEQEEEIDKIKKGEPIKKTRLATNKQGLQYEITINNKRPLTQETAKRRLTQLYGGMCIGCGVTWPDYKIIYDVGDKQQGAKLVQRYCSSCYDKQPIKESKNKK